MEAWPKYPVVYEINTWVWLAELSRKYGTAIDLARVPNAEWDALGSHGFDAVWLMGVWQRSPAGIDISMRNPGLLADFTRALPDFRPEDNIGSPYCVRRYVVDDHLGGTNGLAEARRQLRARGMRLILDLVANHVAPDHPWVEAHPEFFVRGSADDLRSDPVSFVEVRGNVFARGRDPYFPAWPDVLQLNAFQPGLRRSVIEAVATLADQCDGLRCDMAMLLLNAIFERTWGDRAGVRPADEYWATVIAKTKRDHPEFRFLAEAYWDLEWELQQQGFDYCYDKTLYDRMEHGDAESVRRHLRADLPYQEKMVRFLENHDEPRAAATLPSGKARAAAVAVLTLPGAKLLHEGQFEGRKVRPPVFLGRRPAEADDRELAAFYDRLLGATHREVFRSGAWHLCEPTGWPDNQTYRDVLAWCWAQGGERWIVVIHYGDNSAQARIPLPWDDLTGKTWRLEEGLSKAVYERAGDEMRDAGLYVDLGPWACHLFRLSERR